MQEKINNSTYSLSPIGGHTLARVSAAQAERFLEELENLRDEDLKAVERFRRRFGPMLVGIPDLLGRSVENLRNVSGQLISYPPGAAQGGVDLPGEPADLSDIRLDFLRIGALKSMVRSIWVAPNVWEREWRVFLLHGQFVAAASPRFLLPKGLMDSLLPPSPFEQALLHMLKRADRACFCGNPDCKAPYFFAKRRGQKYCSDVCALPAQREFKRRWWAEHGEARRRARKASAKKSQRKRGK